MTINPTRLAKLREANWRPSPGSHPDPVDEDIVATLDDVDPATCEMCIEEAVAWVCTTRWTDKPDECVCPTISAFSRAWNDGMNDEDRAKWLTIDRMLLQIGTAGDEDLSLRRSWMAFDWLVRMQVPTWLRLTPSLVEHADRLADLPEIIDRATCDAALAVLRPAAQAASAAGATCDAALAVLRPAAQAASAAGAAAWDAAGAAAWDAAGDAAGAAAGAAAWDAAGDAAGAAAWDAARAAAWDAAGDAAGAAAAWDAAGATLRPTVEALQASAADLHDRMCALR